MSMMYQKRRFRICIFFGGEKLPGQREGFPFTLRPISAVMKAGIPPLNILPWRGAVTLSTAIWSLPKTIIRRIFIVILSGKVTAAYKDYCRQKAERRLRYSKLPRLELGERISGTEQGKRPGNTNPCIYGTSLSVNAGVCTFWRQQGSNLRPSTRQADALPAELCLRYKEQYNGKQGKMQAPIYGFLKYLHRHMRCSRPRSASVFINLYNSSEHSAFPLFFRAFLDFVVPIIL